MTLSTNTENNPEDEYLVKRVLSGDTHAFATIIKSTERLVAQIIFKMVADNEVRKDLAQDVYLKAFRSLSGFKFQSKLSTWIARITYTTCLTYLDKRKVTEFPMINKEYADDAMGEPGDDVELSFFKQELTGILSKEIEMLPPLYKTVITLYHNEELSYSEIAQITELPEGTLKSYLFRARKTLKDNLLKKYNRDAL